MILVKLHEHFKSTMPSVGWLVVQSAVLLFLLFAPPVFGKQGPNLLLVTLDTVRADRLGCYGYRHAETPVLDQLAREGVRFERAFSTVPLTLPAHASILTGTYPTYHGIRGNAGYVLPPHDVTLAEILKKHGYSTAAFMGAYVLDSKFGLNRGFDFYYDRFDLTRYENTSPGYIRRTGDQVIREALRWLGAERKTPFFVWVHLYDCHDPYWSPPRYASRHPGRPYDGAVAFTDANVGTLVGWLKEIGLYDNTLIVIVGDHGEGLGDHGEDTHGFFVYNASLHVPLIFRFPGGERGGKTIRQNVSIVDLLPTIAQILQINRSNLPAVQGRGLLAMILGKSQEDRPVYAESHYPRLEFGWSELRALITGSNKYILSPKPELYDLSRDFGETRNLAAKNEALANQLQQDLKDLIRRVSSPSAAKPARAPLDAETLEKLRSLGYVALSMGDTTSENFQSLPDPKDEIRTYNEILKLAELDSRGEYASTIPRYLQILKAQPKLMLVHYKLGQAFSHSGNFLAALEQFQYAIALGGDTGPATFQLAMTYLKLGRTEDAILGFRRTLELDPANYQARVNLGVLLTNQSKIPEAIAELEKAVSLVPNSIYALSSLGIAYSLAGQHEKGVEVLKRALALSPNDAFLHANLGAIYKRTGRTAEAEEQFAIARRLNPQLFAP